MIWRSPSFFMSMAARRPRPIRRLISCCRPPLTPRFHGMRCGLDGGIMAYSLVTQPWPRPCKNDGTCSSTAAVHRTHVSPIRIMHDAGVAVRKSGSILTDRICSGARPSACMPGCVTVVLNIFREQPLRLLHGGQVERVAVAQREQERILADLPVEALHAGRSCCLIAYA